MKTIGLLEFVLFLCFPVVAQNEPIVIGFKVMHDGQERPVSEITISNKKQILKIPIQNGYFKISTESIIENFNLSAEIDGELILVAEISSSAFINKHWTLYLAEHKYDEYHQEAAKRIKGLVIPKSCILSFDNVAFRVNQICRSKIK
jgi:hypothetical protein